MLQSEAQGEVTAETVTNQDHLLETKLSSPPFKTIYKLILGLDRIRTKLAAGAPGKPRQVEGDDNFIPRAEQVDIESPQSGPGPKAVDQNYGRGQRLLSDVVVVVNSRPDFARRTFDVPNVDIKTLAGSLQIFQELFLRFLY